MSSLQFASVSPKTHSSETVHVKCMHAHTGMQSATSSGNLRFLWPNLSRLFGRVLVPRGLVSETDLTETRFFTIHPNLSCSYVLQFFLISDKENCFLPLTSFGRTSFWPSLNIRHAGERLTRSAATEARDAPELRFIKRSLSPLNTCLCILIFKSSLLQRVSRHCVGSRGSQEVELGSQSVQKIS